MKQDDTIKALLDRYGGPAPRYTSYPPATRFCPAGREDSYRDILRAMPEGQNVSLYLHIPFCRSLCSYCGCMTRIVHDDDPVRDYVRLLEKEINLVATTLGHRHNVSHIHFGGGSPNLLSRDDINLLLTSIRANFDLAADVEIAMEADPRQMTREKAFDYAHAGINRVSLGVQDFQEETQKAINRLQPFSQIESCTHWLKDAGIGGINFDLMYGLPYQSVDSIADNLRKAMSLSPDRVALFGYAHVPWMKTHQKTLEKYALPDLFERYLQAKKAREMLAQGGYVSIGMDHFAKKDDPMAIACEGGAIRRNFQGYTTDSANTLLAFGISAISRVPEAYVQNTTSFGIYKESLEKGIFPDARWIRVTAEDRLRGEVIENLMCYFTVDCAALCDKYGFSVDYLDDALAALSLMERDGLLEKRARCVTVTETGAPFVRAISACFDAYHEDGMSRHAQAV